MTDETPDRPELTGFEKVSTIGTLIIVISIVVTIVNSLAGGPRLIFDLTTVGLALGLAAVGLTAYLGRSGR